MGFVGTSSAHHLEVGKTQIIVADPNEHTRQLLQDLFQEEMRALVTLLANASELGPMLHETTPDLVVVEVGRDRIAEIALLARLRAEHPSVPLVVLTAWDLPTDREPLEGSIGADVIISKPFRVAEVLSAAECLTRRARDLEPDEVAI